MDFRSNDARRPMYWNMYMKTNTTENWFQPTEMLRKKNGCIQIWFHHKEIESIEWIDRLSSFEISFFARDAIFSASRHNPFKNEQNKIKIDEFIVITVRQKRNDWKINGFYLWVHLYESVMEKKK